jgi:hypothetical protein
MSGVKFQPALDSAVDTSTLLIPLGKSGLDILDDSNVNTV